MLRHLLTSAARTSSRLSFAKSSTVVLAARPPPERSFLKKLITWPAFWVLTGTIGAMFAIKKPMDEATWEATRSYASKNSCYITKVISPTSEPVDAATQSIKKPDLFEDGRIMFAFGNPSFSKDSTSVQLEFSVQISNISFATEYNEICDGLERRGIRKQRSVAGARAGLTEYSARELRKRVAEYSAMKDDSRFSQTAFDDSRVEPDPLTQLFQSKRISNAVVIGSVAYMINPLYTSCVGLGIIWGFMTSFFFGPKEFKLARVPMRKDHYYNTNLPSEPVDATSQSIKNRDPFENGTMELCCGHPTFLDNGSRSDLFAKAEARISLQSGADLKEIHDGLERRGIHVDNSKEGLRRGLTEYAIKVMNEGVDEHFKKFREYMKPTIDDIKSATRLF